MAKTAKMAKTYNYDYADRAIEFLADEVARYFSVLKSLLTLDEINVIGEVGKVFRALSELIRKILLEIAQYYYEFLWEDKKAIQRRLDEIWIEDMLTDYDVVAKYVFKNEEDRKRARLVEAIMASKNPTEEVNPAAKNLFNMYRTFVIRVADEAAIESLKDQGIQYVQWIAELDNRTCSVCQSLDKRIFELPELPDKPHINCRCTIRSVRNNARIPYETPQNAERND